MFAAIVFSLILIVAVGLLWGHGSEANAIERVLQADVMSKANARSVAEVVSRMNAIDLDGCPDDFKSAYLTHIHALESMADVEQRVIALKADSESGAAMVESFIRGFLSDPFGKANEIASASDQLQRDYQTSSKEIRETFNRVQEIAAAKGAKLPKK